MKLEMNICSRSFLRGGILETVGGRSGSGKINEKPETYSASKRIYGYQGRSQIQFYFTLYSRNYFSKHYDHSKGEGEKRNGRALSAARKIRWPNWIGWKIAAGPLDLISHIRFKSLLIKIYSNLEEDS